MGQVLLSLKYEDLIREKRTQSGAKKKYETELVKTTENSGTIINTKEDFFLRNSYIFRGKQKYSDFYKDYVPEKRILFCGHCGKKSEPILNYNEVEKDYSYYLSDISIVEGSSKKDNNKEKKLDAYYCKECGEKIELHEVKETVLGATITELVGINIFENEYKEKSTIKLKVMFKITSAYHELMQIKYYTGFIVFNYVTGFTYEFETRYTDGKKVNKHEPSIRNISYLDSRIGHYIPTKVLIFLADIIREKISENVGYKVPSIHDYLKDNTITLEDIIMYNRMPNVDFKAFRSIINNIRCNYSKGRLPSKIRAIKSSMDNPLKALMDLYKVPYTKSYRKILLDDLNQIGTAAFLSKCFSQDNAVKLLKAKVFSEISYSTLKRNSETLKETFDFIELFKNNFSEKVLVKKLIIEASYNKNNYRNIQYAIKDAARLYFRIKNTDPSKLDTIRYTGNIVDIHDNLSEVYENITRGNYPIDHEKEYRELEDVIDGHKFSFAEDTEKLRDVGRKMHICVGGYDQRALNKKCNIIVVYDSEGEYKVCIELSGDYLSVKQTKLHCNRYPDGEIKNTLLKWIEKNKLIIDTADLDDNSYELEAAF